MPKHLDGIHLSSGHQVQTDWLERYVLAVLARWVSIEMVADVVRLVRLQAYLQTTHSVNKGLRMHGISIQIFKIR